MWFKKKKRLIREAETSRGGFVIGQVVRHKVSGAKAVIVDFSPIYEGDDSADCTVSIGWMARDEFGTTVAELEPFVAAVESAPAINAVGKSTLTVNARKGHSDD